MKQGGKTLNPFYNILNMIILPCQSIKISAENRKWKIKTDIKKLCFFFVVKCVKCLIDKKWENWLKVTKRHQDFHQINSTVFFNLILFYFKHLSCIHLVCASFSFQCGFKFFKLYNFSVLNKEQKDKILFRKAEFRLFEFKIVGKKEWEIGVN